MTKKLAQITSLMFDPRVEIPLLLTLAVVTAYQNGATLLFLGLLLFVDVVLPLAFYLYLQVKGDISHWDITKRKERVPLYVFFSLAQLAGVGLSWLFGEAELTKVLLVYLFLAVMFTGITMLWKVSIHAGVNAALATYLWLISQSRVRWLGFAILIAVAWSRVKLKRHGLPQVLIGGLLGALGLLAGMRVAGL